MEIQELFTDFVLKDENENLAIELPPVCKSLMRSVGKVARYPNGWSSYFADDEKVREHYIPVAERNVKWYALRNKLIEHGSLEVSRDDLNAEIERLVGANTSSENEIRKFYKKPSNLKRLEDVLMEKIILEYLEQFAKVKEVEVQTKDLRGKENEY